MKVVPEQYTMSQFTQGEVVISVVPSCTKRRYVFAGSGMQQGVLDPDVLHQGTSTQPEMAYPKPIGSMPTPVIDHASCCTWSVSAATTTPSS